MTNRTYTTPAAFKHALEQRLREATGSGPEITRRRQRLVFDRFLARVVDVFGNTVTLKGGLVLGLRLERARTTKDIDLRVDGSPIDILARLRTAARRDLGDFMVFEVNPDHRRPAIRNDGMQYEGLRFRAECSLGGKIYGRPFGVDVAFGDPMLGEPQTMIADDFLAFVGVAPPTLRVYPVETHIAEKLHAYTMPRKRHNSRVKDLPDLALIATVGPIDSKRLREAMEQTFSFRDTHEVPSQLPDPSIVWSKPYESMAREDQLSWLTLDEVTGAVRTFLNPVLAGGLAATWVPEEWRWVE